LDCEASCPGQGGLSPLSYEPEEKFEIFGFYGLWFIVIIVYGVLTLVFIALLIILPKLKCTFFSSIVIVTSDQVYLLGQGSPRRCACTACRPLVHLFLITDYDPSYSSISTTTLSWVSACSSIVEHSQQEGFTECRCQRHVKPPTWSRTRDLEHSSFRPQRLKRR
jgi:hypothetical protein